MVVGVDRVKVGSLVRLALRDWGFPAPSYVSKIKLVEEIRGVVGLL